MSKASQSKKSDTKTWLDRDYEKRVAAFRRARGAWKHLNIDHERELKKLYRERDRKLPELRISKKK